MSRKFTSTIAGASLLLTGFGLLSRGFGFVREVLFANYFGMTSQFDVYLVGAVIPLTLNTIILYLAQNYFIPAYNNVRQKDKNLIEKFVQINFLLFVIGGIILSGILYLFSKDIIGIYLQDTQKELLLTTQLIFKIFLLSIPFNAITAFLIANLQLKFEFRSPAYSQLILNISFLALLLIFKNSFGIYIIPIGYVLGSLIQMIFLLKRSKFRVNFLYSFSFIRDFYKFIPRTLLTIILIESVGQLYIIADRYFFYAVPVGGIAALNYAQTVFLLPISILSVALSTALLPKFSHFKSMNLIAKLENSFNESIMVIVAIFVPITIIFIFYGDIILKILYERGKFTGANTNTTYQALVFYSISLLFYAVYSIINKMLYSYGLVKKLLYVTLAGIILKISLNFLFVGKLGQNGLALSSSISYIFFSITSMLLMYNAVVFKNKKIFVHETIFHFINGAIALLIAKGILMSIPNFGYNIFFEISIFFIVYIVNIFIVHHPSTEIFHRTVNLFIDKK